MALIDLKTPPCMVCGERTEITVDKDEYLRWSIGGELAQNVWPDWSPDERELLISGTHSDCWEKMFGGDDASDD